MAQINTVEVSTDKALKIVDSFLIPEEGINRYINAKYNRMTVNKKDQTLIMVHDEDAGCYKITYIPIKKTLFGNDYVEYKGEIKYAYFTAEGMARVKKAFGEVDLDVYVFEHLKALEVKPNLLYVLFRKITGFIILLLALGIVAGGVWYFTHNDDIDADRAHKKQIQDVGCDGHNGVKEYVYYLNINNIYKCNDGTMKIYNDEIKGELNR